MTTEFDELAIKVRALSLAQKEAMKKIIDESIDDSQSLLASFERGWQEAMRDETGKPFDELLREMEQGQ
jgi:hypothetical protein